jgi:two-component system, NarL family, response regulator NreC
MKPFSVLIADDHEVVRRGIRALLATRPEWKISGEASTAEEAIAKAARLKPDIILLDITMPESSGLEAIPEILKTHPEAKILVLTMHDSAQMASRVLAAGASGLVLKSDAANDLISALQAIRKNKPFLSPKVTKILVNEIRQSQNAPSPEVLTTRETEVLKLLAEGKSNKEIAARLGISPRTIDAHRARIMDKLKVHTLSELVHFAIRHKIVDV